MDTTKYHQNEIRKELCSSAEILTERSSNLNPNSNYKLSLR